MWISAYSQNDFTKDFNDRLLKSIYPPIPSQIKFTKNFCEILGMLDEYISRFDYYSGIPHDNLVEGFYPGEKTLAEYFLSLIENYESETSNKFNIIREVGPQGHIYFYSKSLSSLINLLYDRDSNQIASLNKNVILKLPYDLKYAYLKGVYERFGSGNEVSIANGINKLKTVALVMESLKIDNIKLYYSGPNYVPSDYILTFDISFKLKEYLIIKDTISKLIYYPNKRIIDFK